MTASSASGRRAGSAHALRWMLALVLAAGCGSTQLWTPAPIEYGAAARTAGYRARIVLAEQGWEIVGSGDAEAGARDAALSTDGLLAGEPDARRFIIQRVEGSRSALVRLEFGSDELVLEYIDSWNLDYSNATGSAVIDPSYNRWVRSLRSALEAAFAETGA